MNKSLALDSPPRCQCCHNYCLDNHYYGVLTGENCCCYSGHCPSLCGMLADERTVSDPPPRRQECGHGAVSDEASSLDCTEHLAPNGMSSVRIYIDIYLSKPGDLDPCWSSKDNTGKDQDSRRIWEWQWPQWWWGGAVQHQTRVVQLSSHWHTSHLATIPSCTLMLHSHWHGLKYSLDIYKFLCT